MRTLLFKCCLASALLGLLPGWVSAQEPTTLTGLVTDDTGQLLVSANVSVEGMNLGTITNSEGRYLLVVPASRVTGEAVTVTATVIGYASGSQSVTLEPGTVEQDFALATDPLLLEQIVVTGQGLEQERQKLGNTLNSVRAEELDRSQEANVVAALGAKAPGVNITSTAGDPGAGAYIQSGERSRCSGPVSRSSWSMVSRSTTRRTRSRATPRARSRRTEPWTSTPRISRASRF